MRGVKKGPPGRSRDLFGFLDIVALDGQPGVLGIQATSRTNVVARIKKIFGHPQKPGDEGIAAGLKVVNNCRDWLEAGNRVQVWGWYTKPAGKRRRHQLVIYEILLRRNKLVAEKVELP